MRNNKGFSLVELIVVIAIMAILAAVAIPTFATFIGKAQKASDVDFMNQVVSAIELGHATDANKELAELQVVLNDKGEITTIKYTMKNTTDNTNETPIEISKSTTNNDVAAVIDWNYEFKSVKNGTFKVNTDGNALEPVN